MTILYLHGLEGKLSEEKRAILENFGTVTAPDMDYYQDPNVFEMLLKLHEALKFDVVIGSSMGGFMSYQFANTLSCPALLFNPALKKRPVQQNIPELNQSNASYLLHFVLGGQDEVVPANDNLKWISENRMPNTNFKITLLNEMEHRIPQNIFEIEVKEFFRQLDIQKISN